MKTRILSASEPDAIQQVLEVLQQGGLVAIPTDTVYGLGALVFDVAAVERIYTAKGRPGEKAIPVLIGDPLELEKIVLEIPENAAILAEHFWPGPLTLVFPKLPGLPAAVASGATIGVRIPDHRLARALLQQTGPMAVSSANLSGMPNPMTAGEVMEQLDERIDLILDGGRTPGGMPSTVVDCTGQDPQILREGPISKAEIMRILGRDLSS